MNAPFFYRYAKMSGFPRSKSPLRIHWKKEGNDVAFAFSPIDSIDFNAVVVFDGGGDACF